MKQKKTKRIVLGILIGLVCAISTLFTLFLILLFFLGMGGIPKPTRDINRYQEIFAEQGVRTGYISFPETIPDSATDVKYYHIYMDNLFSPTVQTFLQCTYDDATYEKEIDRLENTSKTYGNRVCRLLRDEEHKFAYPAYIAVENAASTYEYALLTGENQITYIFTMYGDAHKVKFDQKYLPTDYMTTKDKSFTSGYSIYYTIVSESGITSDYTRDAVVTVHNTHSRYVGDDYFVVYFTLDADGNEIIDECGYFPWTNDYEVDHGIYYDNLSGKQYLDMTVDFDQKEVTVFYLEKETQNSFTYQLQKEE